VLPQQAVNQQLLRMSDCLACKNATFNHGGCGCVGRASCCILPTLQKSGYPVTGHIGNMPIDAGAPRVECTRPGVDLCLLACQGG
jgi:hypothetical protein